ncbi:hypothetical protein ACET3Z_031712 [Daucus carota]
MDPKKMNRKRFQVAKNDLGVELTKLTNASMDLNSSLEKANELFDNMLKNIKDRQADIVKSCRKLENQYGEAIRVLDDKPNASGDESGGENEVLPKGYAEDVKKFVTDCRDSLNGHGVIMKNECSAMEDLFKSYNNMLHVSIDELKNREVVIGDLRRTLRCKLSIFGRTEVEYSDSK